MDIGIYLCMSQNEIKIPYKFKITNIKVYSMEEAAYHCFIYWKQCYNEIYSDEFLGWVKGVVGLPFLASQIFRLREKEQISDKLMEFLNFFDHFDNIQLASLRGQLVEWEQRLEWERLKDSADYFSEKNQPKKAITLYLKALEFKENYQLFNNLAVSLMKLSRFKEAIYYLEKARILDKNNINILMTLAESFIFEHDFVKAMETLTLVEEQEPENPDIKYLLGEFSKESGDIPYAIDCFKKAIKLKYDEYYIIRLFDAYVKLRQYDNALNILELLEHRGKTYYEKQSEVYLLNNNIPYAIKSIEKTLAINENDVELWVTLAKYHRLDYNLIKAENAISKALSIDEKNDKARKEQAIIRKAQGKTKEYRLELNSILKDYKNNYRNEIML